MLLRDCLSDFEMVPVAPVITGITFCFHIPNALNFYYEARRRYVVEHNLITEVYLMTVMETTTCFGLCWPSSGCLGNLRASYMHARARGVVVSITVIRYTSVIKLCLTTYLLLVSHTQRG